MSKRAWVGGVCAAGLLVAGGARADLQRVNVGVYGGQVRDIAGFADATETNLFIAVESNRGVHWWNALTQIWETVTYPDLPGVASAVECARHAGFEDDVYAILTPPTGPTRLCASEVAGRLGTWTNLSSSGITNPSVLVGHSTGFYVGTRQGEIFLNASGPGAGFSLIYQHPTFTEIHSVAPFDSNLIYATVSPDPSATNLFKLDWNGALFVKTDLVPPPASGGGNTNVRIRLVGVWPGLSNEVFAAGNDAGEVQVYHSTDGGLTWPERWYNDNGSGDFPGGYPSYIKFDSGRVFISHSTLNAGNVWTSVPNAETPIWDGSIVSTHPNDAALEIISTEPTTVYIDTDWAIANAGCTLTGEWTGGAEIGTNKGIAGVILNDFDFFEHTPSNKTLWVAAKSGIGHTLHFNPMALGTSADPTDWIFPLYPDGAPAYSISIQPTNPALVLAGYNSGRIFRSTNAEDTVSTNISWSQVFYGGDHPAVFGTVNNDVTIKAIRFVPSTPDYVFAAGYRWQPPLTNGGIFFSSDAGLTWTNEFSGTPVNCLFVNDHATWAGVGSSETAELGLRARLGPGSWWQPMTGTNIDHEIVNGIDGVILSSQAVVYVVTGGDMTTGSVYRGVNTNLSAGGFTNWVWTDVSAGIGMPQPVTYRAVTVDPADADRAFVAQGNCIYETTDGGATWSVFGTSCTDAHEAVRVLRYDDLMGGTGDGLFGYVYYGNYLELAWSAETGTAYHVTAASSPTGSFKRVSWDTSMTDGSRRTAELSGLPSDKTVILRVEAADGSVPEIESAQLLERAAP